jgi:PmbA protein
VLIRDGVLQGFLHNAHSARRAGTRSTASAVRGYASTPGVGCLALAPSPGGLDPEALRRQVGDGFLVQSVSGLHSGVNPVSGDFSVGAEGVLIRGGELAEPVREVTIASSLQRMLLDVRALGDDLEFTPGGGAGMTVAIADVALSGT